MFAFCILDPRISLTIMVYLSVDNLPKNRVNDGHYLGVLDVVALFLSAMCRTVLAGIQKYMI